MIWLFGVGVLVAAVASAVLLSFALLRFGDWLHAKTRRAESVVAPYRPEMGPLLRVTHEMEAAAGQLLGSAALLALADRGLPGRSSLWDPLMIATALVSAGAFSMTTTGALRSRIQKARDVGRQVPVTPRSSVYARTTVHGTVILGMLVLLVWLFYPQRGRESLGTVSWCLLAYGLAQLVDLWVLRRIEERAGGHLLVRRRGRWRYWPGGYLRRQQSDEASPGGSRSLSQDGGQQIS